MKTILLTLTSLLLTLSAHAQGTVNFANTASTAITNFQTGARVVAGNTFLAQLYYGPPGMVHDESFVSVTNAPIGFAVPGRFLGGSRSTTLPGGSTGSFQVRVWEAAMGGNWETAYANFLTGGYSCLLGKSDVIQVVVGDPYGIPPGTPASLVTAGFRGFYIGTCPEPSSLALGALGVAVLLWRRWRTR